jgi:long-chain fatty acid transport protein
MAGAAVAAPLDSAGALNWNPATISALPGSDVSFGMEMILPGSRVSSQIPYAHLAGTTESEPGTVAVPSMALVRKIDGSPWSWGLGMYGIGGSRVNFPASTTNPAFMSQNYGGFGNVAAQVDVFQMAPTVAYEVNEHVSVGFAPTITSANLVCSPLFLGPSVSGYYPTGVGTRYAWGGGFQTGVYYTTDVGWHYGASFKSPQWMEPFRFNTLDSAQNPQQTTFSLNYPAITSLGVSYSGWDRWVLACDVRFFDYADTLGFGHRGWGSDGALTGLDWNNVWSVALGVQRQLSDSIYVRMGYCFNDNPIDPDSATYNLASPLVIQHTLHLGLSYMFAENWTASAAYVHGFENSVTGPLHSPVGIIPGASITESSWADSLSLGFSKRF